MTVDAAFRPSSARSRPRSAAACRDGTSTPATRPGSAVPCRGSPDSFRSSTPSSLYSVAGVYKGAPAEVQPPSLGGQMGAYRLHDSVFRALRPNSAARGQQYPSRGQLDRPSTAPTQGREAATTFSRMHAGPMRLKTEAQGDEPARPSTAPIPMRHLLRTRTQLSDAETAIHEHPDASYGEDDAVSFGRNSDEDEEFQARPGTSPIHEPLAREPSFGLPAPAVPEKCQRRSERLKQFALHASTIQLRRKPWRADVFLNLKKEVLQEDDPKLRMQLRRLVQLSTSKACQQKSYFVYANLQTWSKVPSESGQVVNLRPWVDQCNVKWYGDTYQRTSFDMDPPAAKQASPPAVVSTASVLESALRLRQACPDNPIVVVAEAVDFDVRGDIDQRSTSGVLPNDLLLQSDFGRLLDQIHRSCREYNQNAGLPKSTMRDYLQDKDTPFIARFNDVSLFRGCAHYGFPFLEEPARITVILMALPEQRVKYQKVHYQSRPSVDWYEQLGDYNALVSRLGLLSKALQDNSGCQCPEAADVAANKPIVIMGVPGCASNVQQPHDAVANCLKHWKQNYSHLYEALHICCRNRRGPDEELCTRVGASVNLRERPPPGLDVMLRDQGPLVQKTRLVSDRVILDDPLDEDETDEAVVRFRQQREITVEMGHNRRGSVTWTSDKVSGFWRQRKHEVQELRKARNAVEEPQVSSPRSQALAMASVNLWVRKKSADMLGFIEQEEDFAEDESLSDASPEVSEIYDVNLAKSSSKTGQELTTSRRSSMPSINPRRASTARIQRKPSDTMAGSQRRASSACIDCLKEQPDWLQKMDEKVGEMRELAAMAKKSIQAKAAGKLLGEKVQARRARFAMRRRSSVTGTIGAGEDFQVFTSQAGEPVVEKHLSSADKKEMGQGVRVETAEKTLKPKFVTDESLKLREETRRRLSQRIEPGVLGDVSRQTSGTCTSGSDLSEPMAPEPGSRRPSVVLDRAVRQAEDIEVASRRASLQADPGPEHRGLGRLRFNWKRGDSFVMPTPPDRPFASADAQFRRRNMRENIMIFRARNEESLTHAGLLDVELAMAECEGVALQLAEQVKEAWQARQAKIALQANSRDR